MRLNELRDNPGATRSRKRVGRGMGSGKGKTAGRGNKGQLSRTGVAIKGFEGGQMAIHRRLPKRGFKNLFRKDFNEVNLGRLQAAIDKGQIDAKAVVTAEVLVAAGVINNIKDGVRVLGKGTLKSALALEVSGISASARKAVEAAGGSVTVSGNGNPTTKSAEGGKRAKQAKSPDNQPAKTSKKGKAAAKGTKDNG